MKKYIFQPIIALLAVTSLVACSEEAATDEVHFNASVVQSAPDFVDPRDNQVYPCVQIGKQVWMTRNLAYRVPGNSLSGCYTWKEVEPAIPEEGVVSDEAFIEIGTKLLADPQYNWDNLTKTRCPQYFGWVRDKLFTQEQALGMMELLFTSFHEVFTQKLKEASSGPERLIQLGYDNFLKYEKENGGYVSQYGYLYSYDAALAAVPEGWRVPTDQDWLELERTLGMQEVEAQKYDAWRGAGMATLLRENGAAKLNLQMGGGNIYMIRRSIQYQNKDQVGYYWTATSYMASDSVRLATFRMTAHYSDKIWRGSTRVTNNYHPMLYSVRLVRDAQ